MAISAAQPVQPASVCSPNSARSARIAELAAISAFGNASFQTPLPVVWSAWRCVSTIRLTGFEVISRSAAIDAAAEVGVRLASTTTTSSSLTISRTLQSSSIPGGFVRTRA